MRPCDAWLGLLAFALWVLAMVALGSMCGCAPDPQRDGSASVVMDEPSSGVIRYVESRCPVCGEPAVADAESMVCSNTGCPACGWPHGAGDSAADVLRELGYEFTEG